MFQLVSTCPTCGAPLFAETPTAISTWDLWPHVPAITYTCICRLSAEPLPTETPLEPYCRPKRKPSAFGGSSLRD
jgi:hypothetical protein